MENFWLKRLYDQEKAGEIEIKEKENAVLKKKLKAATEDDVMCREQLKAAEQQIIMLKETVKAGEQ